MVEPRVELITFTYEFIFLGPSTIRLYIQPPYQLVAVFCLFLCVSMHGRCE